MKSVIYKKNGDAKGAHSLLITLLIGMFVSIWPALGGWQEVAAGHLEVPGMTLIPAGKFAFGDPDEGTKEEIDLKAFYIDKYEVTNEAYKKFKHNHTFPAERATHPVAGITWHEADTYCKSIGKRLPKEEEWEKAARGTDGRAYPWGDEFDKAKANTREGLAPSSQQRSHDHSGGKQDPETKGTVSVGSYEAGKSVYGVYDMAGNVREWTDSWYDDKKVYRVVRGGSYLDDQDSVYTFTVRKSIPEDAKEYIGFRCAK